MSYLKKEDIQNFLDVRGLSYDLLRKLFLKEPTKELLYVLQSGVIKNFPFIDEHPLIKEGVELVKSFFENDQSEKITDRLHWDYTRMFIGPHEPLAPLWGAAYLNEDRLLFQQETLLVRKSYLKYKFIPQHFGFEADDHLGLELDFNYRLTQILVKHLKKNEHKKFKEVIHDQITFTDKHMLRWLPLLKEKIQTHAKYDFYKGIVKILQGFLEIDQDCLGEFLTEKHLQKC